MNLKALRLVSGARGALLLCALWSGAALSLPSPVAAQGTNRSQNAPAQSAPVTVQLQAFKVALDQNGKEQFLDAARAKPGDVLEYRATYANVSQREVKNLQANLPIPQQTELLLSSLVPQGALASADGRAFAPLPLMRSIQTPNGPRKVPLSPAAYRAVRWPLGILSPGQSASVRLRVRLFGTSPSP